jgi:hypothetical protein
LVKISDEAKKAIEDIEEILKHAKEDGITYKAQAFYILGRLYLYSDLGILDISEYGKLYDKMCKQFNFTTEDFDSITH